MGYENEEIEEERRESTRLPATHGHGFGEWTDDVAGGSDGQPVKVPTPETPNERFSDRRLICYVAGMVTPVLF